MCYHCGEFFKQQNATKALCHVARSKGQNIRPCKGDISLECTSLCQQLVRVAEEKKSRNQQKASDFSRLQDSHDDAALRLRLESNPKSQSKSRPGCAKTSFSITSWIRGSPASNPSQVSRGSSISTNPRSIASKSTSAASKTQMTLANGLPNPAANQKAVTLMARFIIDTNKPMWTVDEPLFRRMCLAFRHVDSNFKFPNRETLTKIHLPSHASARHQSAMELLQWGIDLFGVSIQGDGATIKRLPLINLLASGGNCPDAGVPIAMKRILQNDNFWEVHGCCFVKVRCSSPSSPQSD